MGEPGNACSLFDRKPEEYACSVVPGAYRRIIFKTGCDDID